MVGSRLTRLTDWRPVSTKYCSMGLPCQINPNVPIPCNSNANNNANANGMTALWYRDQFFLAVGLLVETCLPLGFHRSHTYICCLLQTQMNGKWLPGSKCSVQGSETETRPNFPNMVKRSFFSRLYIHNKNIVSGGKSSICKLLLLFSHYIHLCFWPQPTHFRLAFMDGHRGISFPNLDLFGAADADDNSDSEFGVGNTATASTNATASASSPLAMSIGMGTLSPVNSHLKRATSIPIPGLKTRGGNIQRKFACAASPGPSGNEKNAFDSAGTVANQSMDASFETFTPHKEANLSNVLDEEETDARPMADQYVKPKPDPKAFEDRGWNSGGSRPGSAAGSGSGNHGSPPTPTRMPPYARPPEIIASRKISRSSSLTQTKMLMDLQPMTSPRTAASQRGELCCL